MSSDVQKLNKPLIKMLKRQFKFVSVECVKLDDNTYLSIPNADINRIYRDMVATRVSIRTALRNLGVLNV